MGLFNKRQAGNDQTRKDVSGDDRHIRKVAPDRSVRRKASTRVLFSAGDILSRQQGSIEGTLCALFRHVWQALQTAYDPVTCVWGALYDPRT